MAWLPYVPVLRWICVDVGIAGFRSPSRTNKSPPAPLHRLPHEDTPYDTEHAYAFFASDPAHPCPVHARDIVRSSFPHIPAPIGPLQPNSTSPLRTHAIRGARTWCMRHACVDAYALCPRRRSPSPCIMSQFGRPRSTCTLSRLARRLLCPLCLASHPLSTPTPRTTENADTQRSRHVQRAPPPFSTLTSPPAYHSPRTPTCSIPAMCSGTHFLAPASPPFLTPRPATLSSTYHLHRRTSALHRIPCRPHVAASTFLEPQRRSVDARGNKTGSALSGSARDMAPSLACFRL
ncbi:hypothetical protein B0H13DRAFT_920228 [Mycena leptocephala]|nr:hypothetical protein B0H13DRAFT_920228 [Mycena leptocephala]